MNNGSMIVERESMKAIGIIRRIDDLRVGGCQNVIYLKFNQEELFIMQ